MAIAVFLFLLKVSGPEIRFSPSEGAVELSGIAEGVAHNVAEWGEVFRVTVDGAGEGAPAILGTYTAHGGAVRFKPLFPFDPGRLYRAHFRPPGKANVVELVFSLPARDLAPHTVVTHVFPSGEVVPENLLKIYIHFSAPMSRADGLPFIHLMDEAGVEVPEPFLPLGVEFWSYDAARYTVFLDPGRVKQGLLPNEQMGRALRAGRSYTLRIDADWRDAEGRGLKAPFEKSFRVAAADTTPIDVATWTIQAPRAGTQELLTIVFPEPLDRGLLERAVGIVTETGDAVKGDIDVGNFESEWRFHPSKPWHPGTYKLVALGILEDLAGNKIGKPFEVDLFDRVERPEERERYELAFRVR